MKTITCPNESRTEGYEIRSPWHYGATHMRPRNARPINWLALAVWGAAALALGGWVWAK